MPVALASLTVVETRPYTGRRLMDMSRLVAFLILSIDWFIDSFWSYDDIEMNVLLLSINWLIETSVASNFDVSSERCVLTWTDVA